MAHAPLILPALALVAGTLWGASVLQWASALWSLTAFIPAVILCLCGRRFTAGIVLLFFGVGWLNQSLRLPRPLDATLEDATVACRVERVDELNGLRRLLCVADSVDSVPCCRFTLSVGVYGEFPLIRPGYRLRLHGTVTPYAVSAAQSVIPDDRPMRPSPPPQAQCTVSGSDVTVTRATPLLRQRLRDMILATGLSDMAGAMVCAITLGDTSLISADLRRDYAWAGLAHVLALSGLHVGIIVIVLSVAMWPLYVGRHNRTRLLLTVGALWAYAWLTGFLPSATRAIIMATIYMTGRVLERRSVALNSLSAAVMVIVLIWPDTIASTGFQMSVAAVGGIILFYPLINCVSRREHPWLSLLWSYPAVSLSAMAFTGFISAYYFHTFPLLFVVANVISALIMPWLLGGGILLVCLLMLGIAHGWLCRAINLLVELNSGVAHLVASVPGSVLTDVYFSPALLVCLLSAVLMAGVGWRLRHRLTAALAAVAVVVGSVAAFAIRPAPATRQFFITPVGSCTAAVVADDSGVSVLTTAPNSADRADCMAALTGRMDRYCARRRLPAPQPMDSVHQGAYFTRRGDYLSVGGRRYCFMHGPATRRLNVPIDYLVVCRGYTGPVVTDAHRFAPDSVLLSSDLNRRRLRRYASELHSASIPFRILPKLP